MRSKNELISFYETAWPEQEKSLHEQLRLCEDKQKIMQFKKHIEKYPHKNRYRYITLTPAFYYFPGSRIVYPSTEFRQLVSLVTQCLNRLEKKEEINYLILIQQLYNAIVSYPYESMFFLIGLMLIPRVRGTIQGDDKPFFHPYNQYRDIPMKYVGESPACWDKSIGASPGKICDINGETHYMKEIVPTSKKQNNKQVLGAYNHRFLSENVGIKVSPETAFFCMGKKKVRCFFSSQKVEYFLEAITLCKQSKDIWCKFNTQTVIDKIGEKSIAELAVANTFIKDLHTRNWGYRTTTKTPDQNRLVILDTDQAPERDLRQHIEFVHKQFSKQKFGIPLRLVDIFYMKNIYLAMQKKPALTYHKSVDMPPTLYKDLLKIFIEACDKTILADTSGGNPGCDDCNSNFAKYVYEIGMNYREDLDKEDSCKEECSEEYSDKTDKKAYR
jgi:hypothetical protein